MEDLAIYVKSNTHCCSINISHTPLVHDWLVYALGCFTSRQFESSSNEEWILDLPYIFQQKRELSHGRHLLQQRRSPLWYSQHGEV